MIYDPLIQTDGVGQPNPALALSWSHSDDLRVWTFKLRDGVRFHNGASFEARDVVYSLKRALSAKLASPVKSVLGIIDRVEAVDPLTVRAVLQQPHADFPRLLMDYRVKIVWAGNHPEDTDSPNSTGVGTGPFKVEQLQPGGTTVLAANSAYWGGAPGVDRIELIGIADSDTQTQALLAGQIDMATVAAKSAALFADRAGFVVQRIPTGAWNPIVMRTDTKPFTDVRVRKALKLIADRQAIIDTVAGRGNGVIACDNPLWPGDPYYDPSIKCPADVDGAKQLLSEAGFKDGLTLDLYTSDVNPTMVQVAQVYQAQAAKAGVTVNIKVAPSNGYWTTVWLKRPFLVGNWGQRPADQVLNEVFRSGAKWNETFWATPEFDALLDKARRTPEFGERRKLYQQAARMLTDEGGSIIPFFLVQARIVSEKLGNVPTVPDISFEWNLVTKRD
ncbi:ABC transporter substrate-binding protein [Mesorhizobium onobrychidis]|uniref:ABC transporter substrate-binding protein n=1 Tax=Mesorhizobium onobrychidis TaxID=2775404 RepID=A0ABY5QW80_9HYPH|nr:ABC transporter substrate-binding protein [Mesorhizobium onobrychidis]UVC15184.1 ABC transporter substrate-binding protein [Mesorhizobium onobrychidis]